MNIGLAEKNLQEFDNARKHYHEAEEIREDLLEASENETEKLTIERHIALGDLNFAEMLREQANNAANDESLSRVKLRVEAKTRVDSAITRYQKQSKDDFSTQGELADCHTLRGKLQLKQLHGEKFDPVEIVLEKFDPENGNSERRHRDELTAVGAGCAVTMPTGDDTAFSVGGQTFNIQNDTAHLIPFLGMLNQSPDQRWFVMGVGGLDIPMRGNQIEFVDPIAGAQDLGRLVDQTLLYLDLTVGRWMYRNPESDTLTGFAVQAELHYAGTLRDANTLQGVVSGVGWNTGFNFGNTRNRFDNAFAALVLHAELQNQTDVRVGWILPVNDANNRFFDSEFIVAVTQRF